MEAGRDRMIHKDGNRLCIVLLVSLISILFTGILLVSATSHDVGTPEIIDTDTDGIEDALDNCPLVPNPGQEDSDEDHVGDACDICPSAFDPDQLDTDNDGLGNACDADDDNDGVLDDGDGSGFIGDSICTDGNTTSCDDNCRINANPLQEDQDGDQVGDVCDNCVSNPNPSQEDYEFDGKGDACDVNLFLLNSVFDPLTESSNLSSKFVTTEETGYYIIQFNGGITEEGITQLENLGVEIFDFVPENALIARFDPLLRPQIETLAFVRDIRILQPADRIDPGIYNLITNNLLAPDVHLNLTIFLFKNANVLEISDLIENLGGTIIFSSDMSLEIDIETGKIINVSFIPDVTYISFPASAFFFGFKTPITVGVRGLSTAPNYFGYGGAGQLVGHFDTGVDESHPDLLNKIIRDDGYSTQFPSGCTEQIFPLRGRGLENPDGTDPIAHGTGTGGIIVGQGFAGSNTNGGVIRGIAPDATVYSTKVCNQGTDLASTLFQGRFDEGDVIAAFSNAYAAGARIHTNSWGSITQLTQKSLTGLCPTITSIPLVSFNYRPYDLAINQFVFERQDTLPFFAASNTGRDLSTIVGFHNPLKLFGTNVFECSAYSTAPGNAFGSGFPITGPFGLGNLANPGTAKNILTVGATEQELSDCMNLYSSGTTNYVPDFCRQVDSDTDLWGGSSRGPTPDRRLKPDVVAPGAGRFLVRSSQGDSEVDDEYPSTLGPGPDYDFDSGRTPEEARYRVSYGTSLATPVAAGIGALIREFYQEEHGLTFPTAALIKATVINGAQDLPDRPTSTNIDRYSQTGPIPNFREGWGRVNFSKSIRPCGEFNRCLQFDEQSVVTEGSSVSYAKRFSEDERLEITMAWTDPPGSLYSTRELINDLQLEMVSPSGKRYISSFNNFNKEGESVPDTQIGVCRSIYIDTSSTANNRVGDNIPFTASDTISLDCNTPERIKSNVRKLILDHPGDGFWDISVVGTEVSKWSSTSPAEQKFAIVFSGIRGVDTVDSTNQLTREFSVTEDIYATAVGLPPNTDVNIYVIENSNFNPTGFDLVNAADPALTLDFTEDSAPLTVTTSAKGIIEPALIWTTSDNIDDILGSSQNFNLVVDVDGPGGGGPDGVFTPGIDFVDYHGEPGFELTCGTIANGHTCGFIESADSTGAKRDSFEKTDTVYAYIAAIALDTTQNTKLYVTPFDLLEEGGEISDKTGSPISITLAEDTLFTSVELAWFGPLQTGIYQLVLDVDNSGTFNADIDIVDPDGFEVSGLVTQMDLDVDSQGNIHAIGVSTAFDSSREFKKLMYAKIPADSGYTIDLENPELFDWSRAKGVSFKHIYNRTVINNPKIAIDLNDEPYIIWGTRAAENLWLQWTKLNASGEIDLKFFSIMGDPGCISQGSTFSECTNEYQAVFGQDMLNVSKSITGVGGSFAHAPLIYYKFSSHEDYRLTEPDIAIDPVDNRPIIVAQVGAAAPTQSWMEFVYPYAAPKLTPIGSYPGGSALLLSPLPGLWNMILVPDIDLPPPNYHGEAVVVGKLFGRRKGTSLAPWPGTQGAFNFGQDVISIGETRSAMMRILGSTVAIPHDESDMWDWIPVDMAGFNRPFSMFTKPSLFVDEDNVHVTYQKNSQFAITINGKCTNTPWDITDTSDVCLDNDYNALLYKKLPFIDPPDNFDAETEYDDYVRRSTLTNSKTEITTGTSTFDFTVDSTGKEHVVWLEDNIIYSNTGTAIFPAFDVVSRPHIVMDTLGNSVISWVEEDAAGIDHLMVKRGSDPEFELASSTTIFDPQLAINQLERPNTWTDRLYAMWLDYDDSVGFRVLHKKTLPHPTILLILDGFSSESLSEQISNGNMVNLESLLAENPSLTGAAATVFPPTTFSSQASMLTALQPKSHAVLGDEFHYSGGVGINKQYLPDSVPSPEDVDLVLHPPTIYNYLNSVGLSKAVLGNMIDKGVGPEPEDLTVYGSIDWNSGDNGAPAIINAYFSPASINTQDTIESNDPADLITIYVLKHDHGVSSKSDPSTFAMPVDQQIIKRIVEKLKEQRMFEDTVFVITSDHGMSPVDPLNNIAFDPDFIVIESDPVFNPDSLVLSTDSLSLNGKLAYYYIDKGSAPYSNVESYGAFFFRNAFEFTDSPLYDTIEKILVKKSGSYFNVGFLVNDQLGLSPATDQRILDLNAANSPEIILVASTTFEAPTDEFYFQEPSEWMYGVQPQDSVVPFIITGPGLSYFGAQDASYSIPVTMDITDVGTTTNYLVAGQNVVDVMTGVDGINLFDPAFVWLAFSPVDLHLYDSEGNHVSPSDNEIPLSYYIENPEDDSKRIVLLQAPGKYRAEFTAFDSGPVHLFLEHDNEAGTFTLQYPEFTVREGSRGRVNMIQDSFDLELDIDGNNVFEETLSPSVFFTVTENETARTALVNLNTISSNLTASIDAKRSTSAELTLTATTDILNKEITIAKNDFNTPSAGLFDLGFEVELLFDPAITANADLLLSIALPETIIQGRNIVKDSISLYQISGGSFIPLDSTFENDNKISASITSAGRYIALTSDLVPNIQNAVVTPAKSNGPVNNLTVRATVTDNEAVNRVTAQFENQVIDLQLGTLSEYMTALLNAPTTTGKYPITITATDNNNNTAETTVFYELDDVAPNITIRLPEDGGFLTRNTFDLEYVVDERSTQSFTLDGQETLLGTRGTGSTTRHAITNLTAGVHIVTIIAVDEVGNIGTADSTFTVDNHNVQVSGFSIPLNAKPGESIPISFTIENTLSFDEPNIDLELLVDSTIVDSKTVAIAGNEVKLESFTWTADLGRHDVTVRAVPIAGERFTEDNEANAEILVTNKIPVLLVEDDGEAQTSSLRNSISGSVVDGFLGFDYVSWDTERRGSPSLGVLKQFKAVVWHTGNESTDTLTGLDQQVIRDFIEKGGNLFMSGNGIGQDIGFTSFYRDVLNSEFVGVSTTNIIEGNFFHSIGRGFLLETSEPGEVIKGTAEAKTAFEYTGSQGAGITVVSDQSHLVYLPFAFESIIEEAEHLKLMESIIEFLDIDVTVPTITVITPADGAKLPIHTPSVTVALETSEVAECRQSILFNAFDSMNAFTETDGLTHFASVEGLSNGVNTTIYLSCRDSDGNIGSEQINIYVHNRTFTPPEIQLIPDTTIFENDVLELELGITDAENDTVSIEIEDFEVLGITRIASRFIVNGSALKLETGFGDEGEYNLRVRVSDEFSRSSTTFKLTISNLNRPPIIEPLSQQFLLEDVYFTTMIQASDPDGDELRFFDNTDLFDIHPFLGTISFTPRNRDAGVHIVNISISDGVHTTSDTMMFDVVDSTDVRFNITNVNDRPEIAFVYPVKVFAGEPFTLQINASDEDGDTLSYSDNSSFFDIDEETGLISFTPTEEQIGSHVFTIYVTDRVTTTRRSINILIEPLPVVMIQPIPLIPVIEGDLVTVNPNVTIGGGSS